MERIKMKTLLGLGAGTLILASMVGCLGVGSTTSSDVSARLSGKTTGLGDSSSCGHQGIKVDEKDSAGTAAKEADSTEKKDSIEVRGCDDKEKGGKDSVEVKDGKAGGGNDTGAVEIHHDANDSGKVAEIGGVMETK